MHQNTPHNCFNRYFFYHNLGLYEAIPVVHKYMHFSSKKRGDAFCDTTDKNKVNL